MKKWGAEDWLLLVIGIFIVGLVLYAVVGCRSSAKSLTKVEYTKGCHIEVEAAGVETAKNVFSDVQFDDCKAGSETTLEDK